MTAATIDCGGAGTDCDEAFATPTAVTLQAVPDPGYLFAGWTSDCAGGATTLIQVTRAKRCTAVFGPASPASGPMATDVLIFSAEPGEHISGGQSAAWTGRTSRFTASGDGWSGVVLRVDGYGATGMSWFLRFAAPTGEW